MFSIIAWADVIFRVNNDCELWVDIWFANQIIGLN